MNAQCRVACLLAATAVLLDASASAAQGWQLVEPMPIARTNHAAATVGGRWYVAGGALPAGGGEDFPSEVDVYDPASGHWTVLGQLARGRQLIVAVADSSHGRILFSGGSLPAGSGGPLALPTCDLALPGGIASAPSLSGSRFMGAGSFAAGKFVVSGGWGAATTLREDAEMWDGTSSAWTAAGTMPAGTRAGHTMTTLKNGREVLVVGGGLPDQSMREVDLLDATSGTWTPAPPLKVSRARHEALLLDDGRVLVVGGGTYVGSASGALIYAELFNPTARVWKSAASMGDPRLGFDMVLLPDGRVLVAGGSNSTTAAAYGALSSAEVYDPVADTWTLLPAMHDRRYWPTLAVLSDGVYVAGGSFSSSTLPDSAIVLASVERLAWSDLGIAGPIDLDAGVPDGSALDAESRDGFGDAGVGHDDAAAPADGALDAFEARDATGPRLARRGCACNAGERGGGSQAILAVACVGLIAALRRRQRKS